eukprot:CAMPEP_0171570154 /NCGR_PEP_ID=MMETSP0961-20121227/2775_1 /TAXON_ID=87120 /ORGANISM="Aurantiochytrium limacinum, Strain ATCCMYA-1381" /LENGTH=662 /DNA_ID=CAMNT_0012124589 /DNA_START=247 /DNA_END=2235 /DNA_ORIENTATION=+
MLSSGIISFFLLVASFWREGLGSAQQCTPINHPHHVQDLPGFAEDQDNGFPCMFAGTIETAADHNLFYWLARYEGEDDDEEVPLVFWLNGGPGASSQLANFLFHGPLRVKANGTGVERTNQTWSRLANVVYLDQPVGTGFSFGEPLLDNMEEVASEFVTFMHAFYKLHEWSRGLPLYLTGESYGGKYLPVFTQALHKAGISVKATLIGNPLVAPLRQRNRMHVLPNALGLLDSAHLSQIASLERRCEEAIGNHQVMSEDACKNITAYIELVSANVHVYDARQFDYDFKPLEDVVLKYLLNPEVHKSIHIDQSTKTPVFEISSARVDHALSLDNVLTYSKVYEDLLSRNAKLLVYAGEFDTKDGPYGQDNWLRDLKFPGRDQFWVQDRKIYRFPDGRVGGYFRSSETFSFMVVPKAGHYVPNNNFETSFAMLEDYIKHGGLQCHESTGKGCSVASDLCGAMHECSGHGTCNSETFGRCQCDEGFGLEDCSLQITRVHDNDETNTYKPGSIKTSGIQWFGFQIYAKTVRIDSDPCSLDVFISRNIHHQPTHLEHDLALYKQTHLRIDQEALSLPPGFRLTVRISGFQEQFNKALDNHFSVEPLSDESSRDTLITKPTSELIAARDVIDINRDSRTIVRGSIFRRGLGGVTNLARRLFNLVFVAH